MLNMDGQKKQVFILTNFSAYLKSYSPIIVVGEQINMLLRNGYEPVLIASEGWNPPEDSIFNQVRTVRLYQPVIDGHIVDKAFETEVDKIYEELNTALPDDAVVFTHDLIFLPDYVKHNVACRRIAAERSGIRWFHMIHSATSPGTLIQEREMFGEQYNKHLSEKFPNSAVMFPNGYDIPRVAKNFGYEEDEVFEVPHPTNPVEGMEYIVKRVYDDKRLWEKEVLMIYPLRLDRGKQAEMNVRLIAACKEEGMTSHLIFCDFQSTGDDKVTYREELKALARELKAEDCVTFLSEFDDSAHMESSHKVVLDLFTLSNIFMLPSKSETYSLVAQEAMLKGNLAILNHDFMPMRQIYGKNAIYRQFSSNIAFDGQDGEINTEYSNIDGFFKDMANNVKYWLENDRVLRAKSWVRVYRNPDYVFQEFIESLLTRRQEDVGEEEIPEAEVLDSPASVLGVGADTERSIGSTPLPRQDRPTSYQVDS